MGIRLPEKMPVMTLADIVLFPQTVMPLYIFETRYRRMLADTLAGDRLFVVANKKNTSEKSGNTTDSPCEIATAGLIRMSSLNPDGTSTIVIQGSERVRITDIITHSPYTIARIQVSPTKGGPLSEQESAIGRKRLLGLVETMAIKLSGNNPDEFYETCDDLDDLETLTYFMLQAYCDDSDLRQKLLETVDIRKRIAQAIKFFESQVTTMKLNKELSQKFPQVPPHKN